MRSPVPAGKGSAESQPMVKGGDPRQVDMHTAGPQRPAVCAVPFSFVVLVVFVVIGTLLMVVNVGA